MIAVPTVKRKAGSMAGWRNKWPQLWPFQRPEKAQDIQAKKRHALEEKLGYHFQDSSWLIQSLTHRSFHHENREKSLGDNERLEFLGDAVIDLAVSDLLMQRFPDAPEGRLSRLRAQLVNTVRLAGIAMELEVPQYLRLGRGEARSGERQNQRLLASSFEAVIGAIYKDGGFTQAFQICGIQFEPIIQRMSADEELDEDFKTQFQERVQKELKQTPYYKLESAEGPDHAKTFVVSIWVGEEKWAEGRGSNKKRAEQDAARIAMTRWT